MSYAMKCDRCGTLYDDGHAQLTYWPDGSAYDTLGRQVGLDLCPACNDQLVEWLNHHRKVIEVDE